MTVVEAQGSQIVPFDTNELQMTMGGRYDVIVTMNQNVDNYWIRTKIIGCDGCSPDRTTVNVQPNLGWENYGILRYSGAQVADPTQPFTPPTLATDYVSPLSPVTFLDTRIKVPVSLAPLLPAPTMHFTMNISSTQVSVPWDTVALRRFWWTNNHLFHMRPVPYLFLASQPNATFSQDDLIFTVPYGAVLDVVYNSFHNQDHPLHLHGFKFWYLGSGPGVYDPATAAPLLNSINPPQLDTIVLEAYTWVLVRFVADNPGAWLMHCHLDFHHAEEMSVLFIIAPERLTGLYPATNFPVCDSYPPYYQKQTSAPTTTTYAPPSADEGIALWIMILGAIVVAVIVIGALLYWNKKRGGEEEGAYLLGGGR